ncbi:sensor histidine kinase [Salmonirosea aquatica]
MDTTDHQQQLEQANVMLAGDIEKLSQEILETRQRLEQQGRLAGIGQLTAGILHEIRNPLNFVNNFSRLALDVLTELKELLSRLRTEPEAVDSDELDELVEMVETNLSRIRENGGRAERIVTSMLSQTRQDATQFVATDLNQLLEEFAKLAYQGVRGEDKAFNVAFTFQLDPQVGQVRLVVNEFTRVIINLVNNACYAVNAKRKLGTDANYTPRITVSSARKADHVEVRIRDNGTGIPEEVVKKVFDAFFTTKPPGEGTGLGLSLSLATINDTHRGTLSVESEPGEFTEFTIRLPLDL